MKYFPTTLSTKESNLLAKSLENELESQEWGLWALEHKEKKRFMGFAGLHQISFEAPFSNSPELGYRLSREFWKQGFATEAGRKILAYAFTVVEIPKIVSFTFIQNLPSRKVMERLGMIHDPSDDFFHPKLPKDHPLRHHVLYKIDRNRYLHSM